MEVRKQDGDLLLINVWGKDSCGHRFPNRVGFVLLVQALQAYKPTVPFDCLQFASVLLKNHTFADTTVSLNILPKGLDFWHGKNYLFKRPVALFELQAVANARVVVI